ncbi:MAG: hypothetical protein R3A79_08090 [Nannocystaceae bacterium]
MSGRCYILPLLGGLCGECTQDADCDGGGCSAPDPFHAGPSQCNAGELGGGCENDAVCQEGLVCATTLDLLAGLLSLKTCGECVDDDACEAGELCAPNLTVSEFKGQMECVTAGSMPLDAFCTLGPAGDAACMSGKCSEVSIMDIETVGACGECTADADCQGGTCEAGALDLNAGVLTGSRCV